ncbi:MAG: hypothetical protein WAT79_13270 [Saprospiraceae bacterium]
MKTLFPLLLLIPSGGFYFFEITPFNKAPKVFEHNLVLSIECKVAKIIENNGIGNEWTFTSLVNDELLTLGQLKKLDLGGLSNIRIFSTAIEEDPNHDDIGISKIEINPDNLKEIIINHEIIEVLKVHEYHGKGAGKTAICEFVYIITLDSIH